MNNPMFRKGISIAALGAILTGSLASCSPGVNPAAFGPGFNTPNSRLGTFSANRNGQKKWLVAIHMAADNNLYSAGLDDLNEIEAGLKDAGAGAEQIEVIVLFDGARQGDSAVYRMKADANGYDRNVISEKIANPITGDPSKAAEIDSGDPRVFAQFSDWVTKTYGAQYNSISIWNHGGGAVRTAPGITPLNYPLDGSGYVPAPLTRGAEPSMFDSILPNRQSGVRASAPSRNFASDDNGGEMKMADLNPALAAVNKNLGRKLDIFGFDTCLMNYIETGYQIKDQANILVASEELEPGDGWDYQAYIGALGKNPNMTPPQLASAMVDVYIKSYMPGGAQRGRDLTLSALDINALDKQLVPALNALGTHFLQNLATEKPAIDAARNQTQTFYNKDAADLGHFLKLYGGASRNPRSAQLVNAVQQAYQQTVIAEGHYSPAMANATGSQIYFPRAATSYKAQYSNPQILRFAEQPAWGNFLKAYTAK